MPITNPNGLNGGNAQNTPTASVPRTFSTFDLAYHFFDTHRFGEYHPHYVEDGVKNDKLPIRSSHNVMSYTLKAPLMQNIKMKKDYFAVPMQAILPLNWEKFFDNPVRGEDVSVDVGTTVESFWHRISGILESFRVSIADYSGSVSGFLTSVLRCLVFGEYFYSNGSLLASLGNHGSKYFHVTSDDGIDYSYDAFVDFICYSINSKITQYKNFTIVVDGVEYIVNIGLNVQRSEIADRNYRPIDFRTCLSMFRESPESYVKSTRGFSLADFSQVVEYFSDWSWSYDDSSDIPCNVARLWAYQLVCSHFYTNDHIDFVYSADLFRQLVEDYYFTLMDNTPAYFSRNGIRYRYDSLSAKHFNDILGLVEGSSLDVDHLLTDMPVVDKVACFWGYFSALFSYRRSLRYNDYFTGSRSQPLAVGSTNVQVSGNTVSVIDITRNIQKQRFLNAVNRVRHNFEGYLQGVFGGDVPPADYHNPFYLAATEDSIYGRETENTASEQYSKEIAITSNLRSNGAKYLIEVELDYPSIILGITHYDLPRVYTKTTERHFLHKDRFDMFNPFMQFIGDQPIYRAELGIGSGDMNNFAYTLRHMEYKQRYNQAAGGFVENLPGFSFLSPDGRGNSNVITPEWIRSLQTEFDNFYVSLTGYSLGSYFHFIVDNYNDCSGSTRPMAYAPSIL